MTRQRDGGPRDNWAATQHPATLLLPATSLKVAETLAAWRYANVLALKWAPEILRALVLSYAELFLSLRRVRLPRVSAAVFTILPNTLQLHQVVQPPTNLGDSYYCF